MKTLAQTFLYKGRSMWPCFQEGDLLVLEDGYPLVEGTLRGLFGIDGVAIRGRMSEDLPRTGELNPDIVRSALGLPALPTAHGPATDLSNRPPALCQGCPHTDSFKVLNDALSGYEDAQVFSDIGCYALAALPPLQAVHSCVAMGASIAGAGTDEITITGPSSQRSRQPAVLIRTCPAPLIPSALQRCLT